MHNGRWRANTIPILNAIRKITSVLTTIAIQIELSLQQIGNRTVETVPPILLYWTENIQINFLDNENSKNSENDFTIIEQNIEKQKQLTP